MNLLELESFDYLDFEWIEISEFLLEYCICVMKMTIVLWVYNNIG